MVSVRNAVSNAAGLLPGPRIGRLCILTSGRTGSELLVDLLDSHPQMRCEGEILRDPQRDGLRFVRGRVRVAAVRKAKAYGFKFIAGQARSLGFRKDMPGFVQSLADDGFVHVRLRRRDLLRQAVSHLRASVTRDYHVRTEPTATGPIHVDPVELIFVMRNIEVLDGALDLAVGDRRRIDLTYEDDLERSDHRDATLARLFALVGLEPAAATSSLRKQTPTPLGDAIENLDEVTAALAKTRYAEHVTG